jgi:hypothetical protein
MRAVVIGVLVIALAGCGGEKAANPAPKPPPAPEVVYLYRVQGDDPLPDAVSLRADGTAAIQRGGGHGGFRTVEVKLTDTETARAVRLTERTPWRKLDGRTVEPGGFGGWDNDMRYMLRRGDHTTWVTDAHMPRSARPLIRELDAIIEGDTGRQVASELHSQTAATIDP